jgi:hypothetical protein
METFFAYLCVRLLEIESLMHLDLIISRINSRNPLTYSEGEKEKERKREKERELLSGMYSHDYGG